MISLSKNEFNVIGFLIRNFSKRFTIRNIASILGVSAAGVHAVLKKLENNGIVKGEKLGTGLFYEVNLGNSIAMHLAAVSLLSHLELKEIDSSEIEKESRAAVFDGKNLLVITSNPDRVNDICYRDLKDIKVNCFDEGKFEDGLAGKERGILDILENGNVLFGEDLILDIIKRVR